jgi:hypothetical protein
MDAPLDAPGINGAPAPDAPPPPAPPPADAPPPDAPPPPPPPPADPAPPVQLASFDQPAPPPSGELTADPAGPQRASTVGYTQQVWEAIQGGDIHGNDALDALAQPPAGN